MTISQLYFDIAATTPIDKDVADLINTINLENKSGHKAKLSDSSTFMQILPSLSVNFFKSKFLY